MDELHHWEARWRDCSRRRAFFATYEPVLILCGGNEDAISSSSELFWERRICGVVVYPESRVVFWQAVGEAG